MPLRASVIHSDPDMLGGTPVFIGTRVPVQTLLDYLEHDHNLSEFLDDFPTVTREGAVAALGEAKEMLMQRAASAERRDTVAADQQTITLELPLSLPERLNELVPEDERAAFILEALQEKLELAEQNAALEEAAGLWSDENHPDLNTDEDIKQWLKNVRQGY